MKIDTRFMSDNLGGSHCKAYLEGHESTAGAGSNAANAGAATSQALRYQSSEIAQAVKTALLNSSSLNDVISEL